MQAKSWFYKILSAVLLMLALFLLLAVFTNTVDQNKKTQKIAFEKQVRKIRDILIGQYSSIPPALRKVSRYETDRKQYKKLLALAEDWRENRLDKGAIYLAWRNNMMVALSENRALSIANNPRFISVFKNHVSGGQDRIKFSLPQNSAVCYAVKTSRGYLLKLAPEAGPQYVKNQWLAIVSTAAKTVQKNGIAYLIFQNSNGILYRFPKTIPKIVPQACPEKDSLFIYGEIIEANGLLWDGKTRLRVGFETASIKRELARFEKGRDFRFLVFLLSLVLLFVALLVYIASHRKTGKMERAVLQHTTEVLIVLSEKGNPLYANRLAKDVFEGDIKTMKKSLFERLTPLKKNLTGKTDFNNFELPAGKKVWQFSGKPVLTTTKDSYYLLLGKDVSYYSEINQRRQLESRLNAMNVLASGVAHEIRNPLNAISMIFQRVRYEYPPAKEDEEYMQLSHTLGNEITRLDLLINQFLSLTRPLKIKIRQFRVEKIFAELMVMAKTYTEERGIKLRLEIEPPNLILSSDADLLKQVMINLIKNAADAIETREDGEINLTAKREETKVLFTVSDNGMGINEKEKEEILNPFYTTKAEGTGLGLSIVQRILTQLGGELTINSVKNIGSEFSFQFSPGND